MPQPKMLLNTYLVVTNTRLTVWVKVYDIKGSLLSSGRGGRDRVDAHWIIDRDSGICGGWWSDVVVSMVRRLEGSLALSSGIGLDGVKMVPVLPAIVLKARHELLFSLVLLIALDLSMKIKWYCIPSPSNLSHQMCPTNMTQTPSYPPPLQY